MAIEISVERYFEQTGVQNDTLPQHTQQMLTSKSQIKGLKESEIKTAK